MCSSRRFTQSSLNSNSTSALDFRASVLQRLRRQSRHSLLSQSRARVLPPTIPEEGEDRDRDQEDALTKARQPGLISSQHEAALSCDAAASRVLESLEERNRLLQDRLASQQSVLDHLLSSKLRVATDNSVLTTTVIATPDDAMTACQDQMIKLSDHFEVSARTKRSSEADHRPLSPSAA